MTIIPMSARDDGHRAAGPAHGARQACLVRRVDDMASIKQAVMANLDGPDCEGERRDSPVEAGFAVVEGIA